MPRPEPSDPSPSRPPLQPTLHSPQSSLSSPNNSPPERTGPVGQSPHPGLHTSHPPFWKHWPLSSLSSHDPMGLRLGVSPSLSLRPWVFLPTHALVSACLTSWPVGSRGQGPQLSPDQHPST